MLLIYLKIPNLKIYYYIKKLKYNIKISNSKGIIKIFNLYIKKLHLLNMYLVKQVNSLYSLHHDKIINEIFFFKKRRRK